MKVRVRQALMLAAMLIVFLGAWGVAPTAYSHAESSRNVDVELNFDLSSLGTEEAMKNLGINTDTPAIAVEVPEGSKLSDALAKAAEENPQALEVRSGYISKAYGLGNALDGISEKLGYDSVPTQHYNYTYAGWCFFVDGEYSNIGANDVVLNKDTQIDFRYALAFKEGGAYDWDFADGYKKIEKAIERAEKINKSEYTTQQYALVEETLAKAKEVKEEIDEESYGVWVHYYQEKGIGLFGPGSITEKLSDAGNKLEKALDKKVNPEEIEANIPQDVYVGKKVKINYQVKPEGASQDVSYEVTDITGKVEITEDGFVKGVKEGFVYIEIISKENSAVKKSFTVTVKALPESIKTADEIFEDTTSYIKGILAPDYDDWMLIGLSRSGNLSEQERTEYYKRVNEYINNDKRDVLYPTDYARTILAMTSAGLDVTDIEGQNLLEPLSDFDFAVKTGINAAAYTLMAYDSHDYEIPKAAKGKEQTTREKLIEYILDREKDDGGWNWNEMAKEADVDMTAMALQALAPYCDSNEQVKEACDKAIKKLSKMQQDNGTYVSWDVESASSSAEVIVALTAMGIDPAKSPDFTKNGKSVIDGLNSLAAENGGYIYGEDKSPNLYSTKQGYYGMAAYYRFISGQTSLYDMSDVNITANPNMPANSGTGSNDDEVNSDKPWQAGSDFGNSNTNTSGSHSSSDKLHDAEGVSTGDNFHIELIILIMTISLIVAVALGFTVKKRS